MKRMMGNVVLLALCLRPAFGQLAITEVMSSASTNLGSLTVTEGPDFWELTNFGTDTIDLDGYRYTDQLDEPQVLLIQPGTAAMSINPGESVIFVRHDVDASVTNEAGFRAWWGTCLLSDVQVRMVPRSPGFDNQFDGVRLYDPTGNLLDQVDFGTARRGVTFVYDTNSAEFGVYSEFNQCGTCKAEQADDVGSPGTTCGPVLLKILAHPTNAAVCAGMDATFVVSAGGLPRPRYKWFFNGAEIAGEVSAILTIANAAPSETGAYQVEIDNGATTLRSTVASLSVSTNPSPPTLVAAPADLTAIAGETARFSAAVCAYPSASYQWRSNGVAILDATNRTLAIPNCALSMSGAEYCLEAENELGRIGSCARLTVTPVPDIRFTELMPAAIPGCGHQDWFELTNFGTNEVNLFGYRFADRLSLTGAQVISERVTLEPGESAIFVEGMSPERFRCWWGADRLPVELPIATYVGLGFSAGGDAIYLWSPGAEDEAEKITSRSYSRATPGISLDFSKGAFARDSVPGECGAFVAAECGDVGSPGYVTNPPPRFVSISREGAIVTLKWRAIVGTNYQVRWKGGLAEPSWTPLLSRTATDWVETVTDPTGPAAGQRFYLIEE